ncbi:MAG: hypothetical protein HC765_01115 [Brachymonas sp.]|nr:hypothetical protein [Brachymonas sp.]
MTRLTTPPNRRRALHTLGAVAAIGALPLLSACGSGSTFEPLVPNRFVSFGDGWSDLAAARYTVNDGSANSIWVEQLAARYGKTIAAAPAGLGFATGGARVNTGANSIADQISSFLASNTITANDVLVVDAGVSEVLALATTLSGAALNTAAEAAARDLATQVRRLLTAGGKHVVASNMLDLGKTPFAINAARVAELASATRAFNDAFKIALATATTDLLLIDNEAYVNLVVNAPASYLGAGAVANASACNAGSNINTNLCTTATAVAAYNTYLFADDRHPTPGMHHLVGNNAYDLIKARW